MIISKFDYCNAILYGLPSTSLGYLQSVQNIAARFITQTRKYDHIKPVLKDLHWLPIRSRIEYKFLTMVHKSLYGCTPLYLRQLLCKRPERGTSLRADGKNNLLVPKVKRATFGARTFRYAGPTLWNALPDSLKKHSRLEKFKKNLKMHILNTSFN